MAEPAPITAEQRALLTPPRRPAAGRAGQALKVRANFLRVQLPQKWSMSQYAVDIQPVVPGPIGQRVFRHLVSSKPEMASQHPVFDGRAIAFCMGSLPEGTFDVQLPEDAEPGRPAGGAPSKRQPRMFHVSLKLASHLDGSALMQHLKGEAARRDVFTVLQALELTFLQKPTLEFLSVRNSVYPPGEEFPLGGGAVMRRGIFQSIRPAMDTLVLNVDVSNGAFYAGGNLAGLIQDAVRRPLNRGELNANEIRAITRVWKNVSIRTKHLPRKYKIKGFTVEPAGHISFEDQEGKRIQLVDYFRERYNVRLELPNMPCAEMINGAKIPIELCEVVKDQRFMRKLSPDQTSNMIKFAAAKPDARERDINRGVETLAFARNEFLNHVGIRVEPRLLEVNARRLEPPRLLYQNDQPFQPQEGSWNLRGTKLRRSQPIKSWLVVSLSDLRREQVEEFVIALVDMAVKSGISIVERRPIVEKINPHNMEQGMGMAWKQAGDRAKQAPQLMIVILPRGGSAAVYQEVKRIADTRIGVVTQCIKSEKLHRPNPAYLANVCLKINAKCGGQNTSLPRERVQFLATKPTMIIGVDVSHPAPGDHQQPSIASVVGSIDRAGTMYRALIAHQQTRMEIVSSFGSMCESLIRGFNQSSGCPPERILIYRDGVSEGQYQEVALREIIEVQAACARISPGYQPTLTFVVVTKRHHARFFAINRNDTDRSGNLKAGTVIDSTVTHPSDFEFYLLSHGGLQGTSRPTRYNVLFDQNNFSSDELQALTYNLCYLQARCTKSVSLVPPVYYAHLAAARGKMHTSRSSDEVSVVSGESNPEYVEMHARVQNTMFFV